jgi:hypothetical protein
MTARNVWLFLTAIFVGPLIGSAVFMAFAYITDGLVAQASRPPTTSNFFADYWPIILIAAYVLGAIPAFISAILVAFIAPRFAKLWERLVAALLIGATTSGLLIGLFIFADDAGSVDDAVIIGGVALTGAVSAVLCLLLVELFHPLPRPPAAPTA